MKRYKLGVAYLFSAVLGAWSGAKAMLDWVGRVGAAQDASDPNGLTAKALLWLFATPWWVPGLIAAAFGAFLLWYLRRPEEIVATKPADQPAHPTFNTLPGQGGSVIVRGNYSGGEGGNAGIAGIQSGGPGGNVHIEGDHSFGLGGDGSNSGEPDGRGGRRSLSPGEHLGLPTQFWAFGYGGNAGNTPEYDRRMAMLTQIRREYFQSFPGDIPYIEAGIDVVPERWVNARLAELNESWRVALDRCGFKMI